MKIVSCYNLNYYRPKWWEHFLLAWLPLLEYDGVDAYIAYKKCFNRMWVYAVREKKATACGFFNPRVN